MRVTKDDLLILNLILSLSLVLFGVGCATMYNPATQRQEFIMIDTPSEVSLGAQVAGEIERKYKLSHDPKYVQRVEVIGKRIAGISDRQDLRYYFKVVEDKEVNAFATPGGHIYVHTGLLDRVNDDELACVIGHEVGHIAARHSMKRLQV